MTAGRAKKRFGQNFLKQSSVAEGLIASIGLGSDDGVLEIGPGRGAMTRLLQKRCRRLEVIEIDRDLIAGLVAMSLQLGETLHQQDVLTFDFDAAKARFGGPYRLVGNLPYNISTPLLGCFEQHASCLVDAHILLQKEVAERLVAPVGSRQYGRLSVMMQNAFSIDLLEYLGPEVFSPAPRVWSCWVRLQSNPKAWSVDHPAYAALQLCSRTAFAMRRKMCCKSLGALFSPEALQNCQINPSDRAQSLDLAAYQRLAEAYVNRKSQETGEGSGQSDRI